VRELFPRGAPTPYICVNASLKLPENQRFEIAGFLALLGSILWFDPRHEHSSIPTAKSRSRRAQGLSRLAASSRPPAGLGLDWPEHGGILDRIGAGGARHIVGKFKPLVLGEIHAAGDTGDVRNLNPACLPQVAEGWGSARRATATGRAALRPRGSSHLAS
jgi:hypothetical protein